MGGSKKNRRKNPANDSGVDLLSLAFNLPTRRDIERADREAAQHQIHTQSIRIQYDPGEDESSDTESSTVLQNVGKPSTQLADETPKARKSSKSPPHPQATQSKSILQLPTLKNRQKRVDHEILPTRRSSKRETSKSPKARERSSSSPASIRAPSPASSIPSSATFPGATSKHFLKAANIAPSDASIRPLQPDIGKGAHPQEYYQPLFAFPTVPMYPPAQYYSAVTKNNPTSDCNPYVPHSMYSRPSTPTNTYQSPQQPSLISQEVQHIQGKLDEVVIKLSKYPEDKTLKGELSSLQTELNTRLNSLLGMEPPKESNVPEASGPHNPKVQKPKSANFQSQHITQRETSPERKTRHHLCTDCGQVRSSNYHSKHPIIPGGKPSTNYCEDCFEKNVENGVLKYHFCYGCGIARSKVFHQYHPISKGDRPFPNYCSVCIEEIRRAETIADVSMVNFAPSRSHENNAHSNTIRDRPLSNKPIESLKLCQGSNSQENQLNVLLFSAHLDGNKTSSHEQKKTPQPVKLSTMGPQLSPTNSSPGSPYYPVRSTGASQRRAERSPLASPGSQYCSSPDTPTTPRYQSPYVEDVTSPVQEVNQRSEDYQRHSKGSSSHNQDDTSHPMATGRQKSQDGGQYYATRSPNYDTSQEVSDDSTEGHASTDDSAHSAGSKSVKFRPKVDVRLSDSRTSSNASSHAKILEEDIKPDDDTVPSRMGVYGTSPVKSQNGYYARAQGNHSASTSSFAGENGYNDSILERSYRGAFSKDSPASSWMPPTSNIGGEHWYSKPTAYHPTTSPSMESFTGFRPGSHSTFNYGSSGGVGGENGLPPFRTSRSAFSPSGPNSTAAFEGSSGDGQESQMPSLSPSSSSKIQPFPDSKSKSWKSYTSPYAGGQNAESSFRKASPWNNFPSRFDSECYTMQDDSSFSQSAFSDYSQPSSNPYYEPRKRPFPDLNDYCSFGAPAPRVPGKWAKEYQSTTRTPKKTPYWIPEPIIEEPDSPVSSPGKRAKMLEFNEIDISPASASNVATESSPDSEDGSSAHTKHIFQSDDDSDKENTLGKSRPDTPSLD
ncbi:hypothetical protein TARUN_1305 [Trichoderma arundinaceum]|uniref:Uncharacterized protein n=1 Tax=Trichoderma arundinaceum TaxID=490622 RepID=A0A395NXS9_TRIAR|nr:hypothetical protein TARUN_1305 [Trichoderma arundinaceum]